MNFKYQALVFSILTITHILLLTTKLRSSAHLYDSMKNNYTDTDADNNAFA